MTKEDVLELLLEHTDTYISGAQLARTLSVSRTAVWKGIEQLRAEGYRIASVTNKGYRLSSDSDILSAAGILKYLRHRELRLEVYRTISSTNTVLKGLAAEGAPEGLALVSGEQTQGRGRMGRSFYSPPDSGVYLSVLLRPGIAAAEATRITACAAVAVARAIENISGAETQIKWVNDILIGGKKVSGILTEASLDCESGTAEYVIVGIGINTCVPRGDFPAELRDIAGAIFSGDRVPEPRCRLAAAVLDGIMDGYAHLDDPGIFEEYKKRSVVLGQPVWVLGAGKEPVSARALDLDSDFALRVRYDDGSVGRLNSGEVSIRARP